MISFDNTEIAFRSKSDKELKKAHWLFKMIGHRSLVKFGKIGVEIARAIHFPLGLFLKNNVFAQFCGGETIEKCAQTTKVLDAHHIGTILDYSVEGKEGEAEFEATKNEILRTVITANNNSHIPFCVFKITGIGRFELLEKVNKKEELNEAEILEFERIQKRVDEICKMALESDTPVFIDAEESWIQNTIDELADTMMHRHNKDRAIVFNTAQMYRWDRLDYIKERIAHFKTQNRFYGIKLVRGAYLEKENVRAEEMDYKSPIQKDKESTDNDFNAAIVYCMDHLEHVSFCAGTHNEASSLLLANLIEEKGLSKNDPRFYFAQLYGMSDHISFNLSNHGFNVAKYVPYGPIREVIPYLIRRAQENTSMDGQTSRELKLIETEMKRRKLS